MPKAVEERAWRYARYEALKAAGGVDDVAPQVVRELGIYRGQAGIYYDAPRTRALTGDGSGVTVSVLHTGTSYPDDLTATEIKYHYPRTARRGSDAAEVNATKSAYYLKLPVFVVANVSVSSNRKHVRLGTIRGWDDDLEVFSIELDAPLPALASDATPWTRRGRTGSAARTTEEPYRDEDETKGSAPRDPFKWDPNKLDRGLIGHKKTQNAIAAWLRARGIEPLSPKGQPSFDIAWRVGSSFFVAEVKSLTLANEDGQLRLGIGQVLDYAQILRDRGEQPTPILVAELRPSDERWTRLCASAGVLLTWAPGFEALSRLVATNDLK